jgi:ADP-heptose:LPS heptosyltransferase
MPSIPNPTDEFRNYRVMDNIGKYLPVPDCKLNAKIHPDDSVLLIRLSAIGDAVRLFPVISYLRNNGFEGTIGVATQPPNAQLFKHHPDVDNVHTIHKDKLFSNPKLLLADLLDIKKGNYRWCFDCHYILKSAVTALFSGSKYRIGYHWKNSKEASPLFQTHTIGRLPDQLPRIFKYISLLRPFTRDYDFTREIITPDIPLFPATQDVQDTGADKPILLHPSTSHSRYGKSKEWGTKNFRVLAAKLSADAAADIYITWGPGEKNLAEEIAAGSPENVRIAPETTSLTDLAHLIQQARLIVTGDTAPCHLADMLGTPLVALFGGSNHLISGPLLTNYRLLVPHNQPGTSAIPTSRVLKATHDLLKTVK